MKKMQFDEGFLIEEEQKSIARKAGQAVVGGAMVVGATQAFAFDTTDTGAIKTEIDATKDDATNVGNMVIGIVLLLALFGILVSMLHKR